MCNTLIWNLNIVLWHIFGHSTVHTWTAFVHTVRRRSIGYEHMRLHQLNANEFVSKNFGFSVEFRFIVQWWFSWSDIFSQIGHSVGWRTSIYRARVRVFNFTHHFMRSRRLFSFASNTLMRSHTFIYSIRTRSHAIFSIRTQRICHLYWDWGGIRFCFCCCESGNRKKKKKHTHAHIVRA